MKHLILTVLGLGVLLILCLMILQIIYMYKKKKYNYDYYDKQQKYISMFQSAFNIYFFIIISLLLNKYLNTINLKVIISLLIANFTGPLYIYTRIIEYKHGENPVPIISLITELITIIAIAYSIICA